MKTTPRIVKLSNCLIVTLLLLFSTTTKAQNDPNCGLYIDGVIADSIPSWGFGEMKVVIPKTAEWDKFDLVVARVYITGTSITMGSFDFLKEDLNDFSDADYIVYNIFTKKDDAQDHAWRMKYSVNYYCSNCKWESYDEGLISPEKRDKTAIKIKVIGYKQTGTSISNDGVRSPVYDSFKRLRSWFSVNEGNDGTLLYQSNKVPYARCYCSYDKASFKVIEKTKQYQDKGRVELLLCSECKIDYSKPPVIPGKKFPFTIEKVDYAGKYGKVKKGASTGSNSKTEVKTNTTTTKTTVTKTTTTKTIGSSTSSSALIASALKPLDKSKAGYFVEKDGDVITKEGYKTNDDALNGEMRIYNSAGKLVYVKNYVNDIQTGYSAEYYENGQLMEGGMLNANGDKEGDWKAYDEKGKLTKTKKYKNGELQN